MPPFRAHHSGARGRDDTVNAASLCGCLAAIKQALEDLPRQAQRYTHWRAKPVEEQRPKVSSAIRPGAAPSSRKTPSHEVDDILTQCHVLAFNLRKAMLKPDTS